LKEPVDGDQKNLTKHVHQAQFHLSTTFFAECRTLRQNYWRCL